MADDEYNRKLESLQQYIPFLNNMIVQLKDPRKKNREQQLNKMESLHSMITDKKKKLKLETLIKCEDVILKLYDKVKSGSQPTQLRPAAPPPPVIKSVTSESPMSPITPSSPSPPRDIPKTKPVVIPTEKVIDRNESQLSQPSSSYKAKIDIYSSAADSLKTNTFGSKPSVFEQLSKKAPDMSKPPISIEDLEALQDDSNGVDTEKMTLNELTDLREMLQKQLSKSDDNNEALQKLTINTTVRNTTILTKKAVEKPVTQEIKQKTPDSKLSSKTPPSSSSNKQPVKVIKEATSIFGSTLSSIDNKLLQDASKKEKERRNSTGQKKDESTEKHKDRRNSKDEKKSESSSSHKSPKDKAEKKSSSESSHKSKDKKDDEKKSPSKDKKEKDEKKSKHDDKPKDDAKKHQDKSKKDGTDKKKDEEKCKESPKTKEDKEKSDSVKTSESGPTFKRLADKYNPKPRKHPVESTTSSTDVPKNVAESIEHSMKTAPVTIPFLDTSQSQPSPPKLVTGSQTPLNVPLLSPTSSTNSMDNEVAVYNRKPQFAPNQQQRPLLQTPTAQLSLPQPQQHPGLLNAPPQQPMPHHMPNTNPQIPTHVSNILANPNVTTIINKVVNQFKVGQGGPVIMPQNSYMPNPQPQPNFGNNFPPPNRDFNNQGPIMPQGGGNYWGGGHNQPQGHMQNFPPRAYTPLPPNQYENQMQPLDYYPQGSTTPNPYSHQGQPPLLSPQYDGYDGRPPPRHERGMDDGLFGNRDRDMRCRENNEWRRQPPHQWSPRDPNSRDPLRDPRIHRDPRSFREDPRNFRREFERDSRPKFRDPRLNRYPPNKYEREKTPSRSRSVSRDSDEASHTFTSPLDSLYTGGDNYRKTGKGYGVQNFKIPKIKRDDEQEGEKEVKVESVETETVVKVQSETEAKAPEPTKTSPEPKTAEPKQAETSAPEQSCVAESSTETPEVAKETDEAVASASVSSSTECNTKKTSEPETETTSKEPEVGEISSTNDIQTNESRDDSKVNDQTEIINKFLKKLLENERTRAAASLFIDNVKNSLDDEKLKMVVETVKSAALEEEQTEEKPKVLKKKKLSVLAKRKQIFRRKLHWRKRRKLLQALEEEEEEEEEKDEEEEVEEEEEEVEEKKTRKQKQKEEEEKKVVVSVGERTKSRKRLAATSTPKRRTKHRTELDLLHEDIQDMFIRDGVLTATGKRMCRLLKSEAESATTATTTTTSPKAEPPRARRTRATAEKFDSKTNSDKLKAMSNVRVLIPKIPVDKLTEVDEDGQRYSLRRANKSNKSYAEDDSDDEKSAKQKEEKAESEKEEEKEEKVEATSEKIEEERDKLVASPKKIRKRPTAWASGIIPKKKKKEVSNEEESKDEDADKSFELVEPDKNYYSSRSMQFKTPCKLCSFNAKNITQHYVLKHPDSEVLSSRLGPSKAESAIKESIELNLDECEDQKLTSTRKYAFQCRFCDLELNCKLANFFDHVSSHTGEYRHRCTLCLYGACNIKPLKIHYMKAHGRERNNKSSFVKTKVYGYICTECNFVQMSKKTVENHVNVYHLGEGTKVLKIYLSALDYLIKDTPKQPKTTVTATSSDENSEELREISEIRKKPSPKKKKISENDDEDETPSAKKQKTYDKPPFLPEEVEETKPLPVSVKKEKEIDMTVFTCNTDLQEENEKIEQERLKMMTELNESVRPNRQSLNFIEELSNRLMQEEKEQKETAAPEMVLVKSEPMELELEPETVFEPEPEPVIMPEITPKKPSKLIEPPISSSSMKVVQKENVMIQGMIQKLQGILKEEKTSTSPEPPPLAPLLEKPKDEGTTVLNAGFLNIVKNSDGYAYCCRVPSCLFVSKDRDRFLSHCNEDHTRINQNYKLTKCKLCNCEITSSNVNTLLMNFFTHVEDEHLGSRRNILRTRRLSGDMLSTTKEEKPDPEEIVPKEDVAEDKEKEDFDIKVDENPFPFKISGVMSLAEEPIPPLSPIKEKASPKKIESVVLKEAKLTTAEKAVAWKCTDAMKKFLQCPRELYKCPQFFCKFATNLRNLFDSHIKAHAALNDELVCCVYCDVKTPLSHAGLHIDLRHSNCLYSCSQCLYRAIEREFVMVHMKVKHNESDPVISLPPKTAKTIMMSKQKRFSIKEACPPYKCGSKGCTSEFLFQNEFCAHLIRGHQGIMICGHKSKLGHCTFKCCVKTETMVDHWKVHSCFNFHCLVCKFGCMELYTMLEHYSLNHPNIEPVVVDRRRSSNPSLVMGYSEEAFAAVNYVDEELLDSINIQQYKIVSADSSEQQKIESKAPEPPKNLTLFPLSLLQGGVTTTNQKFIAIIPQSVDGTSTIPAKLFTALTAKETAVVPEEQVNNTPQSPFVFAAAEETAKEKAVVEDAPKDDENSQMEDERNETAAADPLRLDSESVSMGGDESDSQDTTENHMMKSFGLIGYQLYRCAFCDISFSNGKDFKAHTMHSKQCRDRTNKVKVFKCVHCNRLFKGAHGLIEHIQYHGPLRFSCSLCTKKFPSSFSLKLHMRSKHNVTNTITTPLVPNKTNIERDEFIVKPVPVAEPQISKESPSAPHSSVGKNQFAPDEIDQLPQRHIFVTDLKCAVCPYSTKVRTNLVRHLQFHASEKSVPESAPVNPVPCLEKNEKMFDKMTNLAISSFTGGRMGGPKQEPKEKEQVQVPAYVPSHRRYVCCAEGCNYLCLEEANLRHHLYALHVQEPSFTCAHCKANLKTGIEGFLKHLKLHDLHLYKCSHCPFVHNLRHKVDKHCTDKHPEKMQRTITIRALESEVPEVPGTTAVGVAVDQPPNAAVDHLAAVTAAEAPSAGGNIKYTKPWHCGMCKYRCAAKNDIVTHIFNKHDINTQYKCTLCSYKTNEKATFNDHFKDNHPDMDIDIIHVYYKSEGGAQNVTATATNQKEFDTTPLWQRDRPRVRHIRGILFEETSPQKESKKKVSGGRSATITSMPSTSSSSFTSNLDLAIEAVAKGIDEATKVLEDPLNIPDELKPIEMTLSEEKSTSLLGDESVIVIDDEEEVLLGGDSEESGLLIDVEGEPGDLLEVKMESDDVGFLSEDILVAKYGKLCPPTGKAFRCPICIKFRTKKVSYFVYHLLTELKCHRFKCKSCEYSCVTFDMMVVHCQEEHNSVITANVIDTPIDKTVEYWMQILIRYQARAILQNNTHPIGEETASVGNKSFCEFCQRWFKNVHILKEHELYHWAEQSYTCGHCCSEHVTLNELFQHTLFAHPKFEVSVHTKGPYVDKLIATLRCPTSTTGVQSSTSSTEEVLYCCSFCTESAKSVEALQRHYDDRHKNEEEEFQYKTLTKSSSKVELLFCCTYCHEKGSDEMLKKHHQERHVGLKFSIYQYICLECSGTFLNIKDLRTHYSKVHPGKKVTYSCIENKNSGSSKDAYSCTKCPFRSCTLGGIRSHLRKHLRPVDCLLCGATFIYPTEARAHHNKEHPHNNESVEENKERVKEYEELMQQIIAAKMKETGMATVVRPSPPRRMLARKSTGAPFVREYSFYGAKKEQVDLNKISTSIE